jgi:adenylate cyclase|tara:strand:+ start:889 stop:2868 length:1980 start_codon:yes stop_codon:yes gene_type:complete
VNRKFLSLIIISILIVVYNFETNIKKRIGFINYDYFQTLFEENFSTNKIVIIDIDETSIENIGQFPWRRDVYSKILNNLNLAETSVIAFDIFFSEEDTQNPTKIFQEFNLNSENILNSDQLFLESINNNNVILPLVGATKEIKKNKFSSKANIITKGENPLNYLYNYQGYISSLDKFNNAAKGLGSISIIDSEDGILRYVPLILNIDEKIIPSLSLETVRLYNKEKSYLIQTDQSGIQSIQTRTTNFNINENGLNFVKFKKIPKNTYISASDIYQNNFDQEALKDKIVLIGSSAEGVFDLVKIPTGKIVPGVQVHANIIENILSKDFLKINYLTKITENIVLLISLLVVLIIANYFKPIYSILNYAILLLLLFLISILFYKQNYFVEIYNIILFNSLLFIYLLYSRFVEENKSSIENEKKQLVLKKEREIAGEVQKKLFPTEKNIENFVYAKNIPARDVSGDYYDYIKVSDDEIYFTLADVSGKGIKAGMLMANASSVFKSFSKLKFPINQLAQNINNQVKESSYKGMFITAVIGKLNITSKEVEFVNFGHESIMCFEKTSNSFSYIKAEKPPLGLLNIKDANTINTNKLNLNDKNIFIYTDGVTEGYIEDEKEFTVKGIEDEILKNKSSNIKEIIEIITNKLNNREYLRDDITMMGLQ